MAPHHTNHCYHFYHYDSCHGFCFCSSYHHHFRFDIYYCLSLHYQLYFQGIHPQELQEDRFSKFFRQRYLYPHLHHRSFFGHSRQNCFLELLLDELLVLSCASGSVFLYPLYLFSPNSKEPPCYFLIDNLFFKTNTNNHQLTQSDHSYI